MAKRKKPAEPVSYDWDKILNGKLNRLKQGRDFHCTMHTMYNQIRRAAYKSPKGIKVAIKSEDDTTLLVRSYSKSKKPPVLEAA